MTHTVSGTIAGVKNSVTGSGMRYQWTSVSDSVKGRENVFGLEINIALDGSQMASEVYVCRLSVGHTVMSRKMDLMD